MRDLTTGIIGWRNRLLLLHERCLHYLKGEYAQAIDDLSRGLELQPRVAAALSQRGKAYEFVGECDNALQDYRATLEVSAAKKNDAVPKN